MIESLRDGIQAEIRRGSYRFTIHAGERMIERHIAVSEVEEAILAESAEVIEDYPNDPRGSSCLVLGMTAKERSLHVQCSYPPNVVVITAYEPESTEWLDWRTRREKR